MLWTPVSFKLQDFYKWHDVCLASLLLQHFLCRWLQHNPKQGLLLFILGAQVLIDLLKLSLPWMLGFEASTHACTPLAGVAGKVALI